MTGIMVCMDKVIAVHNGSKLTVKSGKEILYSLETDTLNGLTDSELERAGYARVSPWIRRGRYTRAKLITK